MTKPHFQAAGNSYMDSVIEHVSLVFSSVLGAKGVKTIFPYSWKNKTDLNIGTIIFTNGKLG